jgi:GxxExxY protein
MSDGLVKRILAEPPSAVDQLANSVIGCAIEVHRQLGPGYTEDVYEEARCAELRLNNLPFQRQLVFAVQYKGNKVGEGNLDLLAGEQLTVELKAVTALATVPQAQAKSYLKATGLKLALLINLNVPVLKEGIKRIILS